MGQSTEWYRRNKHRPEVREAAKRRQRKWYRNNIEKARRDSAQQQQRYRERNPEKTKAATERCRVARGERNKKFFEDYKREHPCIHCGEADPVVLDFHHRDPKEKKFTVSAWVFRAKIETLEAEIAKCDVLCANCHRREHLNSGIGERKDGR